MSPYLSISHWAFDTVCLLVAVCCFPLFAVVGITSHATVAVLSLFTLRHLVTYFPSFASSFYISFVPWVGPFVSYISNGNLRQSFIQTLWCYVCVWITMRTVYYFDSISPIPYRDFRWKAKPLKMWYPFYWGFGNRFRLGLTTKMIALVCCLLHSSVYLTCFDLMNTPENDYMKTWNLLWYCKSHAYINIWNIKYRSGFRANFNYSTYNYHIQIIKKTGMVNFTSCASAGI